MTIDWELETENNKDIDGDNCLGTIFIEDENGNKLSERSTYLDSWLFELGESLELLKHSTNLSIEILEEPDHLNVHRLSNGLVISYKNNSLSIKTIGEYKVCIVGAIKRFIDDCTYSKKCSSLMIPDLQRVVNRAN